MQHMHKQNDQAMDVRAYRASIFLSVIRAVCIIEHLN